MIDAYRNYKNRDINFHFQDERPDKKHEFKLVLNVPLETYKRLFEESLNIDLYSKRLEFQYDGKAIKYGVQIPDKAFEGSTNPTVTVKYKTWN